MFLEACSKDACEERSVEKGQREEEGVCQGDDNDEDAKRTIRRPALYGSNITVRDADEKQSEFIGVFWMNHMRKADRFSRLAQKTRAKKRV